MTNGHLVVASSLWHLAKSYELSVNGNAYGISGGVAQLGERRLCKPEVIGSIPFTSTNVRVRLFIWLYTAPLWAVSLFENHIGKRVTALSA